MRVQAVQHHPDHIGLGVQLVAEHLHPAGEVDASAALRHGERPPSGQRLDDQEVLAVPRQMYSQSSRRGAPGRTGSAGWASACNSLLTSSKQITGRAGS